MNGRIWILLLVALAVVMTAGLAGGSVPLAPVDVWRALFGDGERYAVSIVQDLRLPRIALASGAHAEPRVLLMAGVVVGAFCTAAIMVALATAPENTVRGALWWMMGSVGDAYDNVMG